MFPNNGPLRGHNSLGAYWPQMTTNMNFLQCKTYLSSALASGKLRHVDALSHLLGIGEPSPMITRDCELFIGYNDITSAQIISLGTTWYESERGILSELGIARVSANSARQASSTLFSVLLAEVEVHHLRIIEWAHKVNGRRCESHPEDFQFGQTGFVTAKEGFRALRSSLIDWKGAYLRPIVIIGHGVDNATKGLRDHFATNLEEYPILMTLDAQVMARELFDSGGRGPKISLGNLLSGFHINEGTYLHNAGNDAAFTMIAGCLLVRWKHTLSVRDLLWTEDMADVMKLNIKRHNPVRTYGIPKYCTRCESKDHMVSSCIVELLCQRCLKDDPKQATTHDQKHCLLVSEPCKNCLADPENPDLYLNANTHDDQHCLFFKYNPDTSDKTSAKTSEKPSL